MLGRLADIRNAKAVGIFTSDSGEQSDEEITLMFATAAKIQQL
jgi:hypothetical protein